MTRIGAFLLAVAWGVCVPQAAADVYFDDGRTHDLDWYTGSNIQVWDDNFFDIPTTLNVVPGGKAGNQLSVGDSSRVNVSGGEVSALYARANGQVHVQDGSVGWLHAQDQSTADISGGSVQYDVYAEDHSEVRLCGGLLEEDLYAQDDSRVTVSAGRVEKYLYAWHRSTVEISGGSIGYSVQASWDSLLTMTGGTLDSHLSLSNGSRAEVSGGTIGGEIRIGTSTSHESEITFHGTGFTLNGRPAPYGEYDAGGRDFAHGYLGGTLASGDVLDNEIFLYKNSRLVLLPEPGGVVLLVLGGVVVVGKRRRGRR